VDQAFQYVASYHCIGGSGGSVCGWDFGGFSSPSDQAKLSNSTMFWDYEDDDGAGRCFLTFNVRYCLALTPLDSTQYFRIHNLQSTTCTLTFSFYCTDHFANSSSTESPIALTDKIEIFVSTSCPSFPHPIIVTVGDDAYYQDYQLINWFSTNMCPLWRKNGTTWHIYKPGFRVEKVSFD
ncbi:hypothetical protein OV760_27240, partial [Salmonella enterica subsp. enterica serovar 1,4,[5],12:i:-]|nr:hypothetical protein [Salmonella enterica subsp. enterica serovar 1,4,[5],12:i:-]